MTLSNFLSEINTKIQDIANILDNNDKKTIAISALQQFSKDRPYIKIADIDGDGGYDYDLPADWIPEFSVIRQVEYPEGERVPVILESESWNIYRTTSTRKLRLYSATPQSGETVRIEYTTIYSQSTIGSIPAHEQDAFSNLAASLCCATIGRYYAENTDPSIDADSVDYAGMPATWAERAKELMTLYRNFVGKKNNGPAAASGVADLDLGSSRNRDRLTHPQGAR